MLKRDAREIPGRWRTRTSRSCPSTFYDICEYLLMLTPIVDRPQDAVISDSMRDVLRALASRCSVGVVSGRDRTVVEELWG